MTISASTLSEEYCYRLVSKAETEAPEVAERRKHLLKAIRNRRRKSQRFSFLFRNP